MYFKHKLFAFIFNIFSKFPTDNKKISFISDSNGSFQSNLNFIYNEFKKRDSYQFNFFIKDKVSIKQLYDLATSKYIFLNDNFFPMAFMNFNKKTKVIQLWHAPGAFKKFGASVTEDNNEILMLNKINSKIDFLISSSEHVSNFYSEAFQISKDKIKPLGTPRIDYYFQNHDVNHLRELFNEKHPEAIGKKLILYAPTFRDNDSNNNVFNYLDLEKFNQNLSDEYILLLRLHPKINDFYNGKILSDEKFIDCTDFKNEQELLLISDILITDYSSIMIEFALLNKPILFFAYDLDYYVQEDRGFYENYEDFVPGDIVKNTDDLINKIKLNDYNENRNSQFLKTQFNSNDGKASQRIIDFLLNNE